VKDHLKDIERAVKDVRKVNEKLEKLENLLKDIDLEEDGYMKKDLLRKREELIKEFNYVSKVEVNINKKYPHISVTLEKYLSKEEKEAFENFLKKKIRLLLKALNLEKKIQYEINRFKLLESENSD